METITFGGSNIKKNWKEQFSLAMKLIYVTWNKFLHKQLVSTKDSNACNA